MKQRVLIYGLISVVACMGISLGIWVFKASRPMEWSAAEDLNESAKVSVILGRWADDAYGGVEYGGTTRSKVHPKAEVIFFDTAGGMLGIHVPSAHDADSMDVRFTVYADNGAMPTEPRVTSVSILRDEGLRKEFGALLDRLEAGSEREQWEWRKITALALERGQWQRGD